MQVKSLFQLKMRWAPASPSPSVLQCHNKKSIDHSIFNPAPMECSYVVRRIPSSLLCLQLFPLLPYFSHPSQSSQGGLLYSISIDWTSLLFPNGFIWRIADCRLPDPSCEFEASQLTTCDCSKMKIHGWIKQEIYRHLPVPVQSLCSCIPRRVLSPSSYRCTLPSELVDWCREGAASSVDGSL